MKSQSNSFKADNAQTTVKSEQITTQTRNAFRVVTLLLGATIIVDLFYFYLAFQSGAWQMFVLAGVILAFGINLLICLRMMHHNRFRLGVQSIIYGFLIIFLATSLLIADLGLILALSLISLVSVIAAQSLSPDQAGRAIVMGVVVGFITLLVDWFSPAYRLVVPELQTFIPGIVGIMLLIYGFFIARQFKSYSLRVKLIIAFLAVTFIPLSVLVYFNNNSTRELLIDEANLVLLARAEQTRDKIDSFIETNLEVLQIEATLTNWELFLTLLPEQRTPILRLRNRFILESLADRDAEFIVSYALLDKSGENLLDSNLANIGKNEAENDYFREPLKTGRSYVSPVEFLSSDGESYIHFSTPVLSGDEAVGIMRVRYRAAKLQALLEQVKDLAGPQSFAVLFDENYIHLGHSIAPDTLYKLTGPTDPALITELQAARRLPENRLPGELSTNLPDLEQKLANAADQPYFAAEDIASEDAVNQVAVTALKTEPWQVAFFKPQEVFLAPIEAQTQTTLFIVIVIGVILVGVAFGLSQLLAGPIIRLTAVAQQVAEGDLTVQTVVEAEDETGQLAEAFNIMTARLRGLIGSLEQQVNERTADLALSMEVGQRAAAIRELDELLPTITEFIRERFNLYYAQIYFVDDIGHNLLLRAGTGTLGQELLARSHSLPVGTGSIVGQVVATRQSIVVSDTETSDIHRSNSLLPDTRSELAIPLTIEGQVIGVLDMQSDRVDTFTEQNMTVFEAMATQLAISIGSAQQWEVSQAAQQQAGEALRLLTRENWSETLSKQRQALSFAYNLNHITPFKANGNDSEQNEHIAFPLVVQNQPIGQLSVQKPVDRDLSVDEQALLSSVAKQLAQKAENLRLFEATQQQANREHIARQITDKIRASRDIKTALQTAAEELSKALGTTKTVVDLKVDNEQSSEERDLGL